jgi:hemolysin activation/secretion protein
VQVQGYEVQGNTLLQPAALQQRLQAFTGRQALQGLRDAAAAVQEMYRQAGYGGVVAFLPEQPLDAAGAAGATVRIRVVEGRLTRVDIAQNKAFSSANIRASLPSLVTGRTPDVRRIDAEIQLANENPAKTVQVLLQPGTEPATIAAQLTVAEQPVQRFSARVDNTGGERDGRWRAALGWQHANLFDRDQVFGIELQTAPENASSVAVATVSFRAPLYGPLLAIDAYGAYSDVDAGKLATPAGDLSFSGQGSIVGTRLNAYLPRWQNIDQRLIAGLEWREYRNNCSIEGLPQGACGSAGASVAVQPLSLTYTAQAAGDVRAGLSMGLHHNLALGGRHSDAADFEAVRPGSARRYTLWRASAQVAVPVGEWGSIAARLQGQFSGRALVPGEAFGAGGAQSVRGFEERELGGDSGAQLSVEAISAPLGALLGQPELELRALLFADAATVSNRNGDPCLGERSSCRIGSLGAGLRLGWQAWQMRLDVGRAMTSAVTTREGDVRAHFSLSTSF